MDNQTSSHRWWDNSSIVLLVLILTIVCTRLIVTYWTKDLSIIVSVTYLGVITGLSIGYSRFSKIRAFLFSIYYGVFTVIWQLGLTIDQNISWYDRLIVINQRIGITILYLYQRKPVPDNLFFLLLMSILFWFISTHAGFTLIRKADPWKVIIPSGICIVIIHSYDSVVARKIWYLIIYLFFSLILVIRLEYLQRYQKWISDRSHIPSNINHLFSRLALIATIILLLLVWIVPVEAKSYKAAADMWQIIKEPFKDIRKNLANAFASLQSSVGIIPEFYNTNLNLGRGVHLSDNQLFTVQPPANPPSGTRFYWRVRVYNVYDEGKWNSFASENVKIFPENNTLKFPDEPKRKPEEFTFTFTSIRPIVSLFVASQPRWVSIPTQAELSMNSDDTVDILTLKALPSLSAGGSYIVRSSLSGATVHALDNAGEDYPDWVTERYLQLPDSITQRTKDLAKEITKDAKTPYEKVTAITNYLRESIKYTETVPKLPADQEIVDWFLFDLKEGFCNYYASAEVILLRSLGIPARLAVGYAQGEFQSLTRSYMVRQRDAHAWPEIYFPKLGWVEFEPTSSQPMIVRPSGETPRVIPTTSANLRHDINEPDKEEEKPVVHQSTEKAYHSPYLAFFQAILTGSIIVALIILLLLFLIRQRKKIKSLPSFPILLERAFLLLGIEPPKYVKKWAYRASLPVICRAYQTINESLTRLGKQQNLTKTPAERGLILSSIIPELDQQSRILVNEYEMATYGLKTPDIISAKGASKKIKYLAFREILRRSLGGNNSPHIDGIKED